MKLQGRKSVMAASLLALLFVFLGMVGLALVSNFARGTHVAHADSCSGKAVSSPFSGPVGAVIAVCGAGWSTIADGTQVSFGYSTDPNCASNNTIVQNGQQGTMLGGSYSGWFRWPLTTPLSTYTVCAFIANIAAPPANTYTVLSTSPPRITIAPTQIHPSQSVTVTGTNYLPGGTFISLTFQSPNGGTQNFGSTMSSNNGSFSISRTIPGNSLGSDTIVASAGVGQQPTLSASVMFTVTNVPVPTPHPTPTTVPTAAVTMTPTAGASPTATATGIAKTPTSVSATPTVTTPNTGPVQIPTAATPPNTTQTGGGTSAGNGESGQKTFSPLPFALGAVVLLFLLTVLVSAIRTRNRRRRAAELEKELAPSNGPPLEGGNGLIASYMNNSMNLPPISPAPMNGGSMMPMNGNPISPMPGNADLNAGPISAMGNSAWQGQSMPSAQGGMANGGAMPVAAGVPAGIANGASDPDALLEAKMRQAQMGLIAFARPRPGNEEQ